MGFIFNLLVVAFVTCQVQVSTSYRIKRSSVQFSDEEKHLLTSTWQGTIAPLSHENAANLFIDYITRFPEIRNEFFWGRNDKSTMALRVDPKFTGHVHPVFDAVGVGISRLDSMDSLNRFYTSLGEDHIPRNIDPAMFETLAESFVYILEVALGDQFTPAVKAAYVKYYNHVTGLMTAGLMGGDASPLEGITAAEKAAAEAGWAKFAEDVEGNGAATFITLVHDHPQIRDVFPWGGKQVLSVDDADIRRHAELVFKGVGVAFNRISHIHSLDGYYESLGLKHIARRAKVEYFDYIGDALMQTFEQILGDGYSADFISGAGKVYGYITSHMTAGLRGSGELTKAEKADVQAGFAQITDLGLFGAKVFSKLVTLHPEIRSKFPWGGKAVGAADLIQDADVQRHGEQVFRAFALSVQNMDDITALSDYYYNEGLEHIIRNIDTEDFQKLLDAVLSVLSNELGDLYTKDFKRGTESLYSFVVENMLRGMRGEKHLSKAERNEAAAAWNTFKANLVENGVDVFLNLISEHPQLEHAFPWGQKGLSPAKLRSDPDIQRHASLVFGAVSPAFKKLDNLDSLNDFYLDIGNNHLDRNIPPVTFSFLSDAFKKTFHKLLGSDYSDSFESSFDYVYAFITSRMLEGMSGIQTLSDQQKQSIKSAFAKFSENLAGNGVLVFLKFVHDYPNLLHVFPWGHHADVDYEDMFVTYRDFGHNGLTRNQLAAYEEMAAHANQVFGGLAVAVDGIDHLEGLAQYYNALGVRHIPRGATAEQFLWMGDSIIYGFKKVLGADYGSDFETGFHILYNFITKHLNDGLGGGVVLSSTEKSALVAGFNAAKGNLGKIGANAFVNLIEEDESFRNRFPWARNDISTGELRSDAGAIAHGEKVLRGVAVAVQNLDNLNAFVPYFVDEGVRHVPRLVTSDDFHAMANALLPAFEQELGSLYTNDFKNALVALVNFIADNMAKGLNIASSEAIHLDVDEVSDVQTAFYMLGDLGEFGAHVFGRLVHDHPKIRSYFPWGRNDMNENELVSNPATKAHATLVFGTLFKVIEGANNLNDFRSFLVFKGLHHIPRGIKPEHFTWLKAALVAELQKELGDKLTPAGLSGLNKVYEFVQESMLKGLSGSTAVSFSQKVALERGWGIFEENIGANGAKVFVRLIQDHPSFRPYFPWGRNDKTYAELLVDPAVQAHAESVFGGLGAAIHHADNLDATRKYYYDLGVNHLSRAVRKEHFPPLQDASEAVLKELLGDLYTNDFVQGFEAVYGFVVKEMASGLGDSTDLTSNEKEMILAAYSVLSQDLKKNAQDTFLYLIQQYPDLKKEFPWGDIPNSQLRTSDVFNNHVLAVFQGLGVAIDRLGNLASTTNYYINLGQNHITRGATDAAFAAIGESLLHTFKGILGPKYNDEFVTALTHVYEFVIGNMKIGIEGHGDVTYVELSAAEQTAVTEGFAQLSDLGDFGREVFVKFIKDHPETRNLFPWGRNSLHFGALVHSQAAYDHAAVVFKNVAVAVSRIDSLGTLADFYTALGVKHIPRHLEHKHFAWMGDAINAVLEKRLGDAYSQSFHDGFNKVYSFIIGRMERGMTSGKSLSASQREQVTKAWGLFAENLVDNGAAVFAKFVTKYPEYKEVFPWGANADSESAYKYDAGVREHAKIVFSALGDLLSDVTQLKSQRTELVALGRRHIPRHVTLDQLLRLGVVLDEYFEDLLGADASLDFRLGWDIVYANIIDSMSAGLKLGR